MTTYRDWWADGQFENVVPDWYRNPTDVGADWWRVPGSDVYGPRLNSGVGTMVVGTSFYVGYEPIGEAAVGITFRVS